MLTVNELLELCEEQKAKGNGNKKIYISRDDEGNGYHGLYFGFTDTEKDIEVLNDFCEDIEKPYNDKVILG
ncbi:MAG: hypothetical protein VZS44_12570 [Bacilli bacterium]|nr:hypothetical protein [Bacilli bacterium]